MKIDKDDSMKMIIEIEEDDDIEIDFIEVVKIDFMSVFGELLLQPPLGFK